MPSPARLTVLKLAIAGLLGSIGASVALLYAAPVHLRETWGIIEHQEADQYLAAAGLAVEIAPLGRETFVWTYRALLFLSWLSWLMTIVAVSGGASISRRAARLLVLCVGLFLAFAGPPVLSSDAFAYVSYGRLVYAHGLNPYQHGQEALLAAGDPAAAYLFWPVLMPYGPLWPVLMAVLGPFASLGGLFGEVVLHKLLAAGALLLASTAAARAADASADGRGTLTLLAVGLNPLLLMEAPVGGHNDILSIALVMVAAASSLRDRHRQAAVALGLAVALKATALLAVPLLLLDRWRRADRQARARELAWSAVLAMGPALLLSSVFGGPAAVFGAVRDRLDIGAPSASMLWFSRGLITAAFAVGAWIVWRPAEGARATWSTAWVIVSAGVVIGGTTLRFPWYFAWPLVPALANWDERHRILITGIVVCCVLTSWLYTVGP